MRTIAKAAPGQPVEKPLQSAVADATTPPIPSARPQSMPNLALEAPSAQVTSAPMQRSSKLRQNVDDYREKKKLEKVVTKFGSVVPPDAAPLLHRVLNACFERCELGQRTRIDGLPINELFILDSHECVAFVQPWKELGESLSSNRIFVSTGFIKEILGITEDGVVVHDPARLERNLNGLAMALVGMTGAFSHELGHTVDAAEGGAHVDHSASTWGLDDMQAHELRADAEGTLVASSAGLPPGAVLQVLRHFGDKERARPFRRTMLGDGAISTHPTLEVRMSALRHMLTLLHYEEALPDSAMPEFLSADEARVLVDELHAVNSARRALHAPLPTTIPLLLEELTKLLDGGDGDVVDVRFTQLMQQLDEELLAKGDTVDADERAQVQEFFVRWSRKVGEIGERKLLSREALRKKGRQLDGPTPGELGHSVALAQAPFYRSPEHLAWIKRQFGLSRYANQPTDSRLTDLSGKLRRAQALAPVDELYALYRADVQALFSGPLDVREIIRGWYQILSLPAVLAASVDSDFFTLAWPRLSPAERVEFLAKNPYPWGARRDVDAFMTEARLQAARGSAEKKAIWQSYDGFVRHVWESRGTYALVSLCTDVEMVDWGVVARHLELRPHELAQSLRVAAKQLLADPATPNSLEGLTGWRKDFSNPGTRPMNGTFWADDALYASITAGLPQDSELRSRTLDVYFRGHSSSWRDAYGRALAAAADQVSAPVTLAALYAHVSPELRRYEAGSALVHAEALAGLPLPRADKQRLLRELFLGDWIHESKRKSKPAVVPDVGWWPAGGAAQSVLDVLVEEGAIERPGDVFAMLGPPSYSVALLLNHMVDDAHARLASIEALPRKQAQAELLRFVEVLNVPKKGRPNFPLAGPKPIVIDPSIRVTIVHIAEGLGLSGTDKRRLFRILSLDCDSASDSYFVANLAPELSPDEICDCLEGGQLKSADLRLEMAKRVLGPEFDELAREPALEGPGGRYHSSKWLRRAHFLLDKLDKFVGSAGQAKDAYLEELAWSLDVEGSELTALIHERKSTNWRKASPKLANVGSELSQVLLLLTGTARRDAIRFLADPSVGISDDLHRLLRRIDNKNANAWAESLDYVARNSTAFERMPLVEFLLAGGEFALNLEDDYPKNVAREFLGYEPDGTPEKLLTAFLSVVPEHERSVSLAFLLCQRAEGKGGLASLFEVFGTLGIKLGQLASVWNVFGDEASRELRELCDQARPMTKKEIEAVLGSLPEEERRKIKRPARLLGSASFKSVVEVELVGGGTAVVMVQRPHVKEQIEANMKRIRAFLRAAGESGVALPTAMLEALLTNLQEQLLGEVDMRLEAAKIDRVADFTEEMNQHVSPELRAQGWKFNVPRIVEGFAAHPNILVTEQARGVSFDRLPPELQRELGPSIVAANLEMLFKHGVFEPDRHLGNYIVDLETRTIHFIDTAQLEDFTVRKPWSSDERLVLAQFLVALHERSADDVARAALAMTSDSGADRQRILSELRRLFDQSVEHDQAELLTEVVRILVDYGVPPSKRYFFGGLKGLLMLAGSTFVAKSEFDDMLAAHIKTLMLQKIPALVAQGARRILGAD